MVLSQGNLPPLAVTMGDPAGIGPDITIKSWFLREQYNLPPFFVISDTELYKKRARTLDVNLPIVEITSPKEAINAFGSAFPVLPIELHGDVIPGRADVASAKAVLNSIQTAITFIKQKQACAVVTNPIQKSILYNAGFSYPGHTEYLAALAQDIFDEPECLPVMMIAIPELRVVPATLHIPLNAVFEHLTTDILIKTAQVVAADLERCFINNPARIAFTGLNPHAGEEGHLGNEENEIIIPAIKILRDKGYNITGPHPADTLFHKAARKNYDVVIAMYHDQALIPVKTLGFDLGVNTTLGLPFIRTSPDHGTACDIAGLGTANPRSLIEAITLAHRMATKNKQRDSQSA
ncbi:MAG: 4-hydroxythreonine-4-phosphate dehydrogenase PdxA [Pseudomonadota bacterium]